MSRWPRRLFRLLKLQRIPIRGFAGDGPIRLLRASPPEILRSLLERLDVCVVLFFVLSFGNHFHRAEVFGIYVVGVTNFLLVRVRARRLVQRLISLEMHKTPPSYLDGQEIE